MIDQPNSRDLREMQPANGERMKLDFFHDSAILPALHLLPSKMNSPAARAMLLCIALQESRIEHRHQIGGPAHGYFQFEQNGGVRGVLQHVASRGHIEVVLTDLDYGVGASPAECYTAIEHNDILACAFARLLLWTLPDKLPARGEPGIGWAQYLSAWRPGRPHRETFDAFYAQAWDIVGK